MGRHTLLQTLAFVVSTGHNGLHGMQVYACARKAPLALSHRLMCACAAICGCAHMEHRFCSRVDVCASAMLLTHSPGLSAKWDASL